MTQLVRSRLLATGVVALVGLLVWQGCDVTFSKSSSSSGRRSPSGLSRLFIKDTEGLARALVGSDAVYKTTEIGTIPLPGDDDLRIDGFCVDLLTARPNNVRMRLVDEKEASSVDFVSITRPAGSPLEDGPGNLPAAAVAFLDGRQGIFWNDGQTADSTEIAPVYRFCVVLPHAILKPRSRLEIFGSDSPIGTSLDAAILNLANDFFYATSVGDSTMWGNGLDLDQKYSSLVSQHIEEKLNVRVIQTIYAISGAAILRRENDGFCTDDCFESGETPIAFLPITEQVERIEEPEEMDFILVNGCMNDINLGRLLNPFLETNELEDLIQEFCFDEMSALLRKVQDRLPNAAIAVTGYFPYLSEQTGQNAKDAVEEWAQAQEAIDSETPLLDEAFDILIRHAALFNEGSREKLMDAVDAVNAADRGQPIAYADARFGPENAIQAPEAWLWGVGPRPELGEILGAPDFDLFPQDPVLDDRVDDCEDDRVKYAYPLCLFISVGHPNVPGAEAIAAEVIKKLPELGVVPEE
jgi:hypothetical protein